MDILTNSSKQTHIGKMIQMANESNMMIVVSAFISSDMVSMMKKMPTIKDILIYTNLTGYADSAEKVISLHDLAEYCRNNKIQLAIKSDDKLHGKVYLFYKISEDKSMKEKGFILTSGNFTENGLRKNHEFGVCIYDDVQQINMAKLIMDLKTYEVTFDQLSVLVEHAKKFLKDNDNGQKQPTFDIDKYVNLNPSSNSYGDRKYFLKPIGTAIHPFEIGRLLKENDKIGFGEELSSIHRGDVFLCHATGPQMIVGYYLVDSEKQTFAPTDDTDRWGWKFEVACKSIPFSKSWWTYKLYTRDLAEEFLEKNPKKHITFAGGDTLGSLNFGSERIELTKDFAQFIIDKILSSAL